MAMGEDDNFSLSQPHGAAELQSFSFDIIEFNTVEA